MALVPVLVCFVLILLVCGALLKTGLAQRDQVAAEEKRLQAEWLVESGLERAAVKLAASRDYRGETWALSPEELDAPWPGLVTIRVEAVKGDERKRKVTVQSEYPKGTDLRSRQRKEITMDLGAEKAGDRS
jgi:hypothetical protein